VLAVLDDAEVLPKHDQDKLSRLKALYGISRGLTRGEILALDPDDSPTVAWALDRWTDVMSRRSDADSDAA
jgi:hypothetical protein